MNLPEHERDLDGTLTQREGPRLVSYTKFPTLNMQCFLILRLPLILPRGVVMSRQGQKTAVAPAHLYRYYRFQFTDLLSAEVYFGLPTGQIQKTKPGHR